MCTDCRAYDHILPPPHPYPQLVRLGLGPLAFCTSSVQPQLTLDLGPPRTARSQCSCSKPQPGRNLDSPQIPSDDPQFVGLSDGRVWGSGRVFRTDWASQEPIPEAFHPRPRFKAGLCSLLEWREVNVPSGAGGIMTIAIYSAQVAPEPQEQLA